MHTQSSHSAWASIAMAVIVGTASQHTFAVPVIFDVATQFSAVTNPSGVWAYGYETGNGTGPFTPFPTRFNSSGVDFWTFITPPPFTSLPQVAHNPTAAQVIFGTGINNPGEVTFHPGKFGELAVVRFTAPAGAIYDLSALFEDRDTRANLADVSIMRGATQLFFQTVGGSARFVDSFALSAGDVLDFRVGAGPSSYFNDNKRLSVVITADIQSAPEPSTSALLVAAALLAALARRRKGVSVRPRASGARTQIRTAPPGSVCSAGFCAIAAPQS